MKVESLTTRTSVPAFVKPEERATNFKTWQEKWKEQRVKDWEWSSVSDDMAFEALVALTKDFQANEGPAAVTTLVRAATALAMDLPVDQAAFDWAIPLVCRAEDDQPETVTLNMSIRHAAEDSASDDAASDDAAAVGMTLMPENAADRTKLQELGILNDEKTVPSDIALGFLNEAAAAKAASDAGVVLDEPNLDRWDHSAVRQALVAAQHRWPEESSPMQAMVVVAGAVIWLRGKGMKATSNELTLCGVTTGDQPDRAPIDAHLSVRSVTPEPEPAPVSHKRSPR